MEIEKPYHVSKKKNIGPFSEIASADEEI